MLNQNEYATNSNDIDIVVNVQKNEVKDKYLVSTTFSNPARNYRNVVILVIDKSELNHETNKVYPSIGIVGDFNNEFVTSNPNKKTTHSKITLNYECDSRGTAVNYKALSKAISCVRCCESVDMLEEALEEWDEDIQEDYNERHE